MNKATKTVPQILRENICTLFNALNLMIAIALAGVGAWKNILFILIILINTVVGIVQEIKAKRQIERLTLLAQPNVTVLRGGKEQNINPEEIKKGDVLVFAGGSAVCTDCIVKEGRLEVNKAILTGESESVVKLAGDRLLSGGSVIAGRCLATAECGVDECFTSKMVDEVKKTKSSGTELLSSMKKVTGFTGFLIIPLGVLLFNLLRGFLSAASVFGFFFAVLLFSPLLQFSALTAGGALLLAFIAVPSAFLAFLIKIPKQVKYPLPVGR